MLKIFSKVLIIGAHYDDAELGCGCVAARLIKAGVAVYKLTLTDNETRYEKCNINVEKNKSKQESANAAAIIGYQEVDFEAYACNALEYSSKVMQSVESVIDKLEIDTVFVHHPFDFNMDHVASSRIVLTAARKVKNILFYKSNLYENHEFKGNLIISCANELSIKKLALDCYGKEHDRYGSLFSTTIERNKIEGMVRGLESAEIFQIYKITA